MRAYARGFPLILKGSSFSSLPPLPFSPFSPLSLLFFLLSPFPAQPPFGDQVPGPLPTSRGTLGILFPPFADRKVVPRAQRRWLVQEGGAGWPVSEVPFSPSHLKAQCRNCSASASESPLCVALPGRGGSSRGLGASSSLCFALRPGLDGLSSSPVKASSPSSNIWLPGSHPLPYPRNCGCFPSSANLAGPPV